MTIEQFNKRYGVDFLALKMTPMYSALLSVLEENAPHRCPCNLNFPTTAENAPAAILGTVAGYASAFAIISKQLGPHVEQEEPETTFGADNLPTE